MFNKGLKNRVKELEEQLVKLLKYSKDEEEANEEANEEIRTLKHPGKTAPILLIKIGDKNKGWIPSNYHFLFLIKQIKEHKLDEAYNIIFFNYAIETVVTNTFINSNKV